MKFPNGYGSITHLSGNRRRPWAVRKTVNGHQKYLSFFSTRADAMTYLADCNKNLTVYPPQELTFSEIYKLDMQERRRRIAGSTARNYDIAMAKCRSLFARPISSITVSDMQAVIQTISAAGVGNATQKRTRQVMHNVFRYAVKYQIIPPTADISRFVDVDAPRRKYPKRPFITRQINRIKSIADDATNPLAPWAMAVLMMCYSGPRASEFISIQKADVKLKKRTYTIRHSKTAAGKNRIVPISRKVLPYYVNWMNRPGKTLLADESGNPLNYGKFRRHFNAVMKAANCHHTPHECRHTCATWLDDKGANKIAIKRILGHAVHGVTDGIYTHKNIHQLKKAIDLL